MEDWCIIELYWKREESAIRETEAKYGHYLTTIAYRVLADFEDSKESVNDTYLKVWNSIPPHKPTVFAAYLAKIVRQIAIDLFRRKHAKKRPRSEYAVSLAELEECVSAGDTPEQTVEAKLLASAISAYLRKLPRETCDLFLCRYFFLDSISELASYFGYSESKVKSILHRTRIGLREYLREEGFVL